jgi:anti-sigma factor RsiW
MKACASYGLLVSRYIDNDLDRDESRLLQQHIGVCGACRATLDDFVKMKRLVCTSFSPAEDFTMAAGAGKPIPAPVQRLRWDLRLAALLVLASTIVAGFSAHILKAPEIQAHAVVTSDNSSVMNAPLGSLVYYQEFAGNEVHSQFVNVRSSPVIDIDQETETLTQDASYQSPLFSDDITTDQYYASE